MGGEIPISVLVAAYPVPRCAWRVGACESSLRAWGEGQRPPTLPLLFPSRDTWSSRPTMLLRAAALLTAASAASWPRPSCVAPRVASRACIACRAKGESWARRLPASTPLGPGSVLAAAPESYDHYFMDSLVLLIEHSAATGSKAVLLNHETPWTVADMASSLGEVRRPPLAPSPLESS